MKSKILSIVFILIATVMCSTSFCQTSPYHFDWEEIKKKDGIPHREALWLRDSISDIDRKRVFDLVSALSRPATAQMLVAYAHIDGSYKRKSIKLYLDSLSIRPPDGEVGIIRVAYLVSKLRSTLVALSKRNTFYMPLFTGDSINVPKYSVDKINKNIELIFDYKPAEVIIQILSKPNSSYSEISEKVSFHQFDKLIQHHNQSFYDTPLTKERLVTCLQIASSSNPIDLLYKYMNPYGLLNFTDVTDNLPNYTKQLGDLKKNEKSILNYINARITPLLPKTAKFSRKLSFFYIDGADGWAADDVAALDLNYFKDNYALLLRLLVHETYHSGQNAVEIVDSTNKPANIKTFTNVLQGIFSEGTATYIEPPSVKTKEERKIEVEKGVMLLEKVYDGAILTFNEPEIQILYNEGQNSGGPFYFLGAEMTRVIVNNLGEAKLASIIPYGGITFFKTYLDAVSKSKIEKNMFSKGLSKYISDTTKK